MNNDDRLNQLYTLAKETGKYSDTAIEHALKTTDFSASTPQEFLEYLELDKMYSTRLEIAQQAEDPMKILEDRIKEVTLSVSGLDLFYEAQYISDDLLKLIYFKELVYSLICQFDKPWVQDCIKVCMQKWNRNIEVVTYITRFLQEQGYDTTDFDACISAIVANAPTLIANDPAPDLWKTYYLLHEIYQDANPDFANMVTLKINSGPSRMSFAKHYEDHLYNDMPEQVANQKAYEDVAEENPGLFAKAGSVVGRVMNFKYDCSKNFNDALRQNLGDNADAYFAQREQQQALRQQQKQQRYFEAQQRNDPNFLYQQQMMQQRQNASYYGQSQYSQYYNNLQNNQQDLFGQLNNGLFNQQNTGLFEQQPQNFFDPRMQNVQPRDFAPKIPPFGIAIIAHVIIVLLTWLLAPAMSAFFMTAGLAVATFGWIRQKIGEPNAVTFMVGGYVVALLSLIA